MLSINHHWVFLGRAHKFNDSHRVRIQYARFDSTHQTTLMSNKTRHYDKPHAIVALIPQISHFAVLFASRSFRISMGNIQIAFCLGNKHNAVRQIHPKIC